MPELMPKPQVRHQVYLRETQIIPSDIPKISKF